MNFKYVFVLCFLLQLKYADSSLTVQAEPGAVEVGVTDSLNVTCVYSHENSTLDIVTLVSLTLTLSNDAGLTFKDLATIYNYPENLTNHISDDNFTTSGFLDPQQRSEFSLKWLKPSLHETGQYKCIATGLDRVGRYVTISAFLDVTESDRIKQLEHRLNTLETVLTTLNNTLSERVARLEYIQHTVGDVLFSHSFVHNNKAYSLTRQLYRNIDVARLACQLYGGYLVELDDAGEYTALVNFLSTFTHMDGVFISGTDEGSEGVWYQFQSGQLMPFLDWGPTAPNGGGVQNCVVMWRVEGWKMFDDPCYNNTGNLHAVCEVPLAVQP
ncbi:uncharacterized protein LOC131937011 [Physella acuta]|uniref:uncharacterized protein LOC131937011 n=1 Tax=Physella acuta TaxID=109671 RepID=UPI0027DB5F8A|nr:uncharacterized protein LOC131937011 [Physella acuta]